MPISQPLTAQSPGGPLEFTARLRLGMALVASLLFAWVLWRTAWMCDDAFITLRTIDNAVSHHGLRWNVAERVQSFTHPAWLLLLTPFHALTREPFFTTLAVQAVLAIGTMYVLVRHVALSAGQAAVAIALFVSSKALTEYSTSGLENPLTHAALLGIFLCWRDVTAGQPALTRLAAFTSLALLCRQDLVLLVGPVLAAAFVATRGPRLRAVLIGLMPLAAWHVFSFIYYGSLIPNTALAKLATGIPVSELVPQGRDYWRATFLIDPVTVVAIAAGALALAAGYRRAGWIVLAGALLYALYLVRVGGDFMSGRFLTPLLFWLLLGLAGLPSRAWALGRPALALAPALVIVVGGLFAPAPPPLLSDASHGANPREDEFGHFGVADERKFYYPTLGLLPRLGYGGPVQDNEWATTGRNVRARTTELQVIAASNVGLFGYYAGPAVHVVDRNGLCDPLIARLPAKRPWRIGHFTRDVPDGYLETWRTGTNAIADPGVAALYEHVQLVTQGPIWSARRFQTAALLALGRLRP